MVHTPRWTSSIAAIALAWAAIATVPSQAASASYPGGNGLIAFQRNGDIWTMISNGTNLHRLTATGDNEWPRWSPDGSRIAFDSSRTGHAQIYEMHADGTGLVQVTTAASNQRHPTWSPNGAKLAFQSDRDGRSNDCNPLLLNNIYTLRATAPYGPLVAVTHEVGHIVDASGPQWSPDGRTIMFERTNWLYCEPSWVIPYIYSVAATGGVEHRLHTGDGRSWGANWAPGGNKIAFVTDRDSIGAPELGDGPMNIYQANPDGTHATSVTHFTTIDDYVYNITWAPHNGTMLVFSAQRPGYYQGLFRINANGTGLRTLIHDPAGVYDDQPDWQPT